jgi:hypothetical protein
MRRLVCRFVLLAVSIAAVATAADPALRDTVIVPLRLSSNYVPAAVSKSPIDKELRVGVFLPFFDSAVNATWTLPVRWVGNIDLFKPIPKGNILEVDRVIVNAAEAVSDVAPRIFRRLFPRAEVISNRECPSCDVVFILKAESESIVDYQNTIRGMTVTVSITAVANDGATLLSLVGEGVGRQAKPIYWSQNTMARGIGTPALQAAMEQLFSKFATDPRLRRYLDEKIAERARPCDIETHVVFDDDRSFFPNRRLDAGEIARLRFRIRNQGPGPAFRVLLRLGMAAESIGVPAEMEAGDFAPGETKELDVAITAGIDLETAQQELRVETLEKRGYAGRPVIVQLATERLARPKLEIADVRIEDRGGRTRGDGDGRASNGETVEAVVLVRNSGPGDAVGGALTISSTPGIEIGESSMNVGPIVANAVKEVRATLRIPITFDSDELRLALRLTETRGAAVATAERQQRWPLRTKRPKVEISLRLFDGNSPQSRGNRDGVANNGETLELAIVASNRGALAARGVRLHLSAAVGGISMQPASIDIGDLPPLAEGAEHRVKLTVPRALGRNDLLQRLPVNVTITQVDFPAVEQMSAIPFSVQRPGLTAALTAETPVVEGKAALFALDLRNGGPLAAEDVMVDVTSDNPDVELLDASGAPARFIRVAVGSISAEASSGRIRFRAHVKRNVAAVAAVLKVLVSQKDFAAVAVQQALTILKEGAALISAIPTPEAKVVLTGAAGNPAAVSFTRYRDGSEVADQSVGLTFEVQAQTRLEAVRLEQNHRAIELLTTSETRTALGYLWQYEAVAHLDYGANEFEVVVITSEGLRTSRSMTLRREKPRGRVWLAVVGISSYREPSINDLDFAKDDAVAVRAYYRQLGVPEEQIVGLLNEDATLANIKRTLGTDLVKHATNPDDTVLIYFAGHGEKEADRSSADSDGYSKYLLPHDANPADLFGSALSMEELSRILQRLRPERVVVIIDSCFSGAAGGRTLFEPNASRGVKISEEFLSRMASAGKGRVILTASGGQEVAQESTQTRHGVFTYFLLDGLRGAADSDHDGRIDVDEIYNTFRKK